MNEQNNKNIEEDTQIIKKPRGRPKKAITEKVKLVEEKGIDKRKIRAW